MKKTKKVYTVTIKFVMSTLVETSQSTTNMVQAMRYTASLASNVESAMKTYGYGRLDMLDVNISVKDVAEESIPEHTGEWFWCTLNGEPYCSGREDIPSGEDPIDYVDKYYKALDLASPVRAFKIEGKIFEHWFEVVEYCKNKLGE